MDKQEILKASFGENIMTKGLFGCFNASPGGASLLNAAQPMKFHPGTTPGIRGSILLCLVQEIF